MYQVVFDSIDGTGEIFATFSQVLRPTAYDDLSKPYNVSSTPREQYGRASAAKVIRLGNGGLGPTGFLREACERFLAETKLGDSVRFDWVCNPSRTTQIALQAGKVDLALTYERDNEALAEREGWSKAVGVLCHDHWVLVGPTNDPANLASIRDPVEALKAIAGHKAAFHTRGDGSATMSMEHALWDDAGIPLNEREQSEWYQRVPGSPIDALRHANATGAYVFVDRATFLYGQTQGWASNTSVWIERQPALLNTCVICVRQDESRAEILAFVDWLRSDSAQKLIEDFGTDKLQGLPWLSRATQEEMSSKDALRPA